LIRSEFVRSSIFFACGSKSGNTPVVKVDGPPKEREGCFFALCLDGYQVRELAREVFDALGRLHQIRVDIRAQQTFRCIGAEPRLEVLVPLWVARHLSRRGKEAGLGPGAFKQDHIENLDLVQPIALGPEELPPLFDGRVDKRIVVGRKENVRTVSI
jgi:hypothetical protein